MFFKLHANCIPVKGAAQSVICDLQRNILYPIPNSLHSLLQEFEEKSIQEVLEQYSEDAAVISEYLDFLKENDLGFETPEPEKFPPLSTDYFSPEPLHNALIEMDAIELGTLSSAIKALISLNCRFVELWYYRTFDIEKVNLVARLIENSTINSVKLYAPFLGTEELQSISQITSLDLRFDIPVVHSCPQSLKAEEQYKGLIQCVSTKIRSSASCGCISKNNFAVNIEVFTESQAYNTCLNRKVSIKADGTIRNCPVMSNGFGNINVDSLATIIHSTAFQKYWKVNKDQIEVCQDCEFRYVCTDCRGLLTNPDNELSKPLKCGYDPYTAEWSNWKQNKEKLEVFSVYESHLF